MKIGNALIVDDEMTIRQGLTKLIESNAPNWNVVGQARNGLEAVEKIKELRPELVMTDIRMPQMDGIELAGEIHAHYPDTKVVILTGYKDWEYAQAAIRYGVLDFLLKPCPEKELLKVLDSAYQSVQKDAKTKETQRMERRLIEEHTVRSLMLRLPYDARKLEALRCEYVGKELLLVKVATYYPNTKTYRPEDLSLLQFAITNVTEEMMNAHHLSGTLMLVVHDVYALFLDAHPAAPKFAEALRNTIKQVLDLSIAIYPMGTVDELHRLPDTLRRTLNGQDVRNESPLSEGSVTGDPIDLPSVNQNKIRAVQDEIMSNMMLGQAESMKNYVGNYIDTLSSLSIGDAKLEALTLVLSFFVIIQKEFASEHSETAIAIPIDELHPLENIDEVLSWTRKQEARFYDEFHRWLMNKNENIVAKSIRYIEDNYMEGCSLKEVANHVHLSPNYFSNLFKKETGESFVNYLTKVRIDKAKLLVSNTEMKMFEIAEAVGYDDPNYFTTVFKQLTKLSPSEYRKQAKSK